MTWRSCSKASQNPRPFKQTASAPYCATCTRGRWSAPNMLDNWLLIYVAYDRKQRILEVCLNHGTRHQYPYVPLSTALALVRASDPANYWKENIEKRHRPSAQVRGRYHTEREILRDGEGACGTCYVNRHGTRFARAGKLSPTSLRRYSVKSQSR
jgi:hypothetical protein